MPASHTPLPQYFDPSTHQDTVYTRWVQSGAFTPTPPSADDSARTPYVISMPPPNATGTLHLGHAVMLAIEDLMVRWRRMAGDDVLWLPGTDHAAIATEAVVIRQLQAEGMADPRAELGREELVRRIAEFVEASRSRIRSQIRAMGSSCDWTRERYTMDPALNRCVNAVFARMFRDGLVYRGPRIVNWDPALQTTVSDDEIYHEERAARFYTLRYGPFQVGTSRPETKLGDTAVAVHPEDPRWRAHIGSAYEVSWPKGPTISVRVVGDPSVDPETGTGALGVTPAHSQVDFEIAQRHDLPLVQVIGEDGRMTEAAGPYYAGMTVEECRAVFVAELEAAGLLAEVRDYTQPISLCYRSKMPIEPLPKEQWFISVDEPAVHWKGRRQSIKQVLRDVVASGDIRILPEHEAKTYFHWVDNLRDWCISRQIWWGHRVPVWYRGAEDLYVGHRPPEGDGWTQDPDTLDTWFSSALWTWSTLVDPALAENPDVDLRELLARSPDFRRFHPTTVMETGYDILFFWVARMILATTYATGQVPFRTVYLHGLVLDRDGDKMSKSKPETCIDPLDTIAEHGADTLRLALVIGNAPGKDLKLTPERITGCKRLINKLWNAAKLVQATLGDRDRALRVPPHPGPLPPAGGEGERHPAGGADRAGGGERNVPTVDGAAGDAVEHPVNRWMLSRVSALVDLVDRRFADYAFGDAAEQVRASFWGELCDFYLEAIKVEPLAGAAETAATLDHAFATYLKLFHPFMPFVTETLWDALGQEGLLISAAWPTPDSRHAFAAEAAGVDAVTRLVNLVRGVRAEQKIDPGTKVDVVVRPKGDASVLEACRPIVERLVRAERLEIGGDFTTGDAVAVDPAFEAAVRLGAADVAVERQRLEKQLGAARGRLAGLEKRLQNDAFVTKAKPEAVQKTRDDATAVRTEIAAVEERLASLG